ncbi:MAG: DUF29 domain-containing protein [Acetobacteraceae bacterium]|nr:DUF29 domain-containing protein [Acetobacteraceae bacterium]
MSDLYETDILAWSEDQAARLRRLAASDRLNDASPDWPNVIEEIEDVGRSSLRAVRSLLTRALVHMLKAEAWPLSRDAPHWRAEARLFRREARDEFSPSMRQRVDLARLYANALAALPETIDGQPPLPVPAECSVTLDALLSEE